MRSKETKEYKDFRKFFKKRKKKLVKYAKEFMAFDYHFMERLIYECIRIYYEFYKTPSNLAQDTTSSFNTWQEDVNALKRCVEIIDKLENVDWDTWEEERDLKYEFYDLTKQYHFGWWD